MWQWANDLFPICRSITGKGFLSSLQYFASVHADLSIHSVPSGTKAFDWIVPEEWNITDAFIEDSSGNRVLSFADNNLHVVGYSEPIDLYLTLDELLPKIYSLPEKPNTIPYITSYYQRDWGFCIEDSKKKSLIPDLYHVYIGSNLSSGHLHYGELLIPSTEQSEQEIFLSTYLCHPSMANNELSGPVVSSALALWLKSLPIRRYNYRFVFIPETIGSIVYLSRNLEHLRSYVYAGFNVSCVGDDRSYSYLPSRLGDTPSDLIAKHVLHHIDPNFVSYNWSQRGSDERQYCSPHVNLPIASIMRTKYGEYPEYHTSDDLLGTVVTQTGLLGGFQALRLALQSMEMNTYPAAVYPCEPQLGKRGLYPNLSQVGSYDNVQLMVDLLTWSDSRHSLLDIAEKLRIPIWDLHPVFLLLQTHGLLTASDAPPRSSACQ